MYHTVCLPAFGIKIIIPNLDFPLASRFLAYKCFSMQETLPHHGMWVERYQGQGVIIPTGLAVALMVWTHGPQSVAQP